MILNSEKTKEKEEMQNIYNPFVYRKRFALFESSIIQDYNLWQAGNNVNPIIINHQPSKADVCWRSLEKSAIRNEEKIYIIRNLVKNHEDFYISAIYSTSSTVDKLHVMYIRVHDAWISSARIFPFNILHILHFNSML